MGKAVELPDPLQSLPNANAASADDLLDQLVGDQIDRFLDRPERSTDSIKASPCAGVLALYAPPVHPLSSPEPAPVDLSSKLESVFSQVEMTVAELKWSTPAPRDVPEETIDPFDDPTSFAEKSGLAEFSGPTISSEENAALRADEDSAVTSDLPAYLRPLAWLNAPLARCSEHARQTVGKVAIVTLINSLALLIYVMFFR